MKRWTLLVMLSTAVTVFANDVKVFEIRDFRRKDWIEQGFVLRDKVTLHIEARGASDRWGDEMLAYGWILESNSRDIVWSMADSDNFERSRDFNRRVDESIDLPAGKYELYYAVSPRGAWERNYRDFGDFLEDLFDGFRGSKWRRDARDWGIELAVNDSDEADIELIDIQDEDDAIVQIAPTGDDEFEKIGFSLTRRTKLRVYAIGEGDDDEMYDYGWIVDGKTRKTIWEMDYRSTRRAGGAEKNRILDEEITLPAGDYMVYYVTDGSHSYEDWNSLPPYDMRFWGITLWGVERGFRRESVVTPYEPEEDRRIIVDISRVGNDFFEKEGFTLKKRMKVRVLCLGEMGSGRRFVDYGGILDAHTREPVWEMTRRNTQSAGGGKKNRMFDGVIDLDAGDYEVFYLSDGSHAYRRWNVSPPYDPEAWGITLWGVEDFSDNDVESYREREDPNVLVQMIRLGDHEKIRRRFTLDETTDIRIYAIGEGDDDEMYDYGWIENDRGREVWEMEYWDTEHAGGARKNRYVNDVITLRPGEYTVRFITDGSHSFEDWNAAIPRDPDHWGITVRIEK